MELPLGVNIPGLSKDIYCLKILKNLYGDKEAGFWLIFCILNAINSSGSSACLRNSFSAALVTLFDVSIAYTLMLTLLLWIVDLLVTCLSLK
jgi:hypothetical protein